MSCSDQGSALQLWRKWWIRGLCPLTLMRCQVKSGPQQVGCDWRRKDAKDNLLISKHRLEYSDIDIFLHDKEIIHMSTIQIQSVIVVQAPWAPSSLWSF